jgi:hypothetical protein
MLTLLEACVCCFGGANLPAVGSELQSFGAEGADWSKSRLSESALAPDGNGSRGVPRRPFMDAVAWWVVLALKARRVGWPWLCRKSTATRKRAGRVKVAVRKRDKRCRV